MFYESGISPLYRQDHLLIRAIVSQFVTWEELRNRFITERAESNKYLKKILASNNVVRQMIADVLQGNSHEDVKERLTKYIDNTDTPWADASDIDKDYCNMAVYRLRYDIKLYDWIASKETSKKVFFQVHQYDGHIMFAAPRKWYTKVALDTERATIAYTIANKYGFEYSDLNQLNMFRQFGDSSGNELWLKKGLGECLFWIGFCQNHELRIQLECKTKEYAEKLFELLKSYDRGYIDEANLKIKIPNLTHFKATTTIEELSKKIEDILYKLGF